jgi:hypothetical protein
MKRLCVLILLSLLVGYAAVAQEAESVRATARLNLRACPDARSCSVVGVLEPETQMRVISRSGEWIQVQAAPGGETGWVHSQYTAVSAPTPAETAARGGAMPPVLLILLGVLPVLLGSAVWLMKPGSALARMEAWNGWVLRKKEKAQADTGFLSKYWLRPILWTAELLIRWTEKIPDPFLRCGTRIAAYLYFAFAVVAGTLIFAYIAFAVVVAIIMVFVTIWILLKVLGSSDGDEERGYRTSAAAKPDREDRSRRMLLGVGAKGATLHEKTGLFSEEKTGRVDEQGRVFRKTGLFSEEMVGRIDDEGRVFEKTGLFSEEQTGRISEDGRVYEKSGLFSEEQIGHVAEDGRVYRKTGIFSEEQVGRVDTDN